jgi:hypothetical protein
MEVVGVRITTTTLGHLSRSALLEREVEDVKSQPASEDWKEFDAQVNKGRERVYY